MSSGPVCNCEERKKPISQRKWKITKYKCNHSAFNGYHETYSDYSEIECEVCLAFWRTKASYVYDLLKLRKE